MITVKKINEGKFLVTVEEGNSRTGHNVELDDEYYKKLTQGRITEEELKKNLLSSFLSANPENPFFPDLI